MFKFENAGKYNSIKERKCKTAVIAVFVFTAVVYIMLILLMIITKFKVLTPLIKFHDTVVYSYNDSGEVVKDSKYNSEYIMEQLQNEFEDSPGLILFPVCITSASIIIGQGISVLTTRKNGRFIFSNSVLGVTIDGIFNGIFILASLFVNLWLAFATIPKIGSIIEPSRIYGWLFLLPLILLDILFVSLYYKAANLEEQ